MNHKVLLADDSLTIQKVIKITLSNLPYEITESSSEDELFGKLPSLQPKLVLLDFNLSEKYTGYELVTKIKSICPHTKILLLLGTFDTVDDLSMQKCGASEKIIKPFDSNKFIAICKNLIDTFDNEVVPYPEIKNDDEELFEINNEEDNWTLNQSTEILLDKSEKKLSVPTQPETNLLHKEISDWGMSIPGVINDETSSTELIDIPPVIIHQVSSSNKNNQPATKYPANEDLDYPNLEVLQNSSKILNLDNQADDLLNLELEPIYATIDNVKSIEAQIHDEIADDLWNADEVEGIQEEFVDKSENSKNNFQPSLKDFDESILKPLDKKQPNPSIEISEPNDSTTSVLLGTKKTDYDFQIKNNIEILVKKYVKEYLDELFQKQAEKVAWEVIPDLAENLIRQELNKISNKILNDQK
jgi:CheY-like chemotaxis protein